jgi:hypothetical protein
MPRALPLSPGEITYSTAKDEEVNILHRLRYPAEEVKFFNHINNKRSWIKAVVAHHLNLRSPTLCQVADVKTQTSCWHKKSQVIPSPNLYPSLLQLPWRGAKMTKITYNSGYSLVVTHPTTNPPISSLCMAERTGCPILLSLWSYVEVLGWGRVISWCVCLTDGPMVMVV